VGDLGVWAAYKKKEHETKAEKVLGSVPVPYRSGSGSARNRFKLQACKDGVGTAT